MKISLNWLRDFVDIPRDITPQKLAEDLTVSTVEVEQVIDQAKAYDKIVVGEIVKIENHPNADKLKVCSVIIGPTDSVQIICGGINLYEGMKTAVALPRAKIRWHPAPEQARCGAGGKGDFITLEKKNIRGQTSFGMICSANEIGLKDEFPPDEPYVMDLKGIKVKPGTPLVKALGLDDFIIEIDNKSLTNRPDLWSHQGIAREIAAIYGLSSWRKLAARGADNATIGSQDSIAPTKSSGLQNDKLNIIIEDNKLCRRFVGCLVEGVKVESSPDWLQARLRAVGLKPINNIVDITNFVMADLGQPMHAFDASKLASKQVTGNRIQVTKDKKLEVRGQMLVVIRRSKQGEIITTLDGEERKLDTEMLIVADKEKPIAIAGVMGGEETQVAPETKDIIFEAANFNAVSVRRTELKLDLRTEASMRFDKGLDPERAMLGMHRAIHLLQELNPEIKIHLIEDKFPAPLEKKEIEVAHEFIEKRIGQKFEKEEVVSILERLGFVLRQAQDDKLYKIIVPSWRATGDVSLPEDIVEEVARIYGYNNLDYKPPIVELQEVPQQIEQETIWQTKDYLAKTADMHEVYNYPWTEQRISNVLKKYGMDSETIDIAFPPTAENKHLARYLLHNLLKNIETNLRFKDSFRIFELSRIFKPNKAKESNKEVLPDQPKHLAGFIVSTKKSESKVYAEIKGIINGLLSELKINYKLNSKDNNNWFEFGAETKIEINKETLGEFGLLNKKISKDLKIDTIVAYFDLDFDLLVKAQKKEIKYKPIPEFPAVTRDIAIIVDNNIKYADLENVIKNSSKLLESVELFDIYEGDQISTNKRSLAWHLSFRDQKKTLTSKEADKELEKITRILENEFGAKLRT